MSKKYCLTDTTKEINGVTLHQIKALKSFGDVKEGDLGGWIEKEANLSQESDAWVYCNALVYGDAWVSGDAWVYGDARVYGNALVYGNAWVYGDARVYGDVLVYGKIKISKGLLFGMKYENEKIQEIDIEGSEDKILGKNVQLDTEDIQEMTLEEICKVLGKKIKIIE